MMRRHFELMHRGAVQLSHKLYFVFAKCQKGFS